VIQIQIATLIILVLTLAAAVTTLVLFLRQRKLHRAESRQLISQLDQGLAASVKLLEVRNYYHDASAALQKMLKAAYKEGNRFRQDEIRKLVDRLETLKVRVLDKSVRILEPGDTPRPKRRRRSRRPRKRTPPANRGAPKDRGTPKDRGPKKD